MRRSLLVLICSLLGLTSALAEPAPIRVGWIGPLTGNAAALGVDSVPSLQMVFDQVNGRGGISGHKLELVVEDDQYNTSKAVTAYQKLVHQDKINVIVTVTYGALHALAPVAEKDGVLLIDPLDCDEPIAKLPNSALCVSKTTEALGVTLAEAVVKAGDLPAGAIYFQGDPFMGIVTDATEKRLNELGSGFALKESYDDNTQDFSSILLKYKAAGLKSIFLYGYDQLGLAAKQARQIGFEVPIYTLAVATSPGFQKLAGKAGNGMRMATWQAVRSPRYSAYLDQFRKRVGRDPILEISTIPSYDIAELLVRSLTEGAWDDFKQNIDAARVQKFFLGIKDYQGLSGIITMDPDGITRSLSVKMQIFSDGKFTPMAPPQSK